MLCRSVPRRVASCCGVLLCGALWCGVPWSRVVPRWVSGGQPGLCGSVRSIYIYIYMGTGGRRADEGTPHTWWGSRPCPPFPLLHAPWCCMSHTSLPARHVSWPRVAFVPSPHPCPTHRDRTGGANGPWVGPREPWVGPQEPQHCYSEVEGGVTSWRAVTPDAEPGPPPVPHPSWGGAACTCGSSPRRPCNAIQAVRAARSAEGPRTALRTPTHSGWR